MANAKHKIISIKEYKEKQEKKERKEIARVILERAKKLQW